MAYEAVVLKLDGSEPRRGCEAAQGNDNEGLLRLGIRQRARLYEISRAFSELIQLDELLPAVIAQTKTLFEVESGGRMERLTTDIDLE